jgi:hypothetical protein
VKSVVASGLFAGLFLVAIPAPSVAQDVLTARVLVDVCLPYAARSQDFEDSIRAARNLNFRRPAGDREPLEEWASEVNLISQDGRWRLRIEEGPMERDGRDAYAATCSISSIHASARELRLLGDRAFSDERYWDVPQKGGGEWNRRTRRPDEYQMEVRVTEESGERPVLAIRGLYF